MEQKSKKSVRSASVADWKVASNALRGPTGGVRAVDIERTEERGVADGAEHAVHDIEAVVVDDAGGDVRSRRRGRGVGMSLDVLSQVAR